MIEAREIDRTGFVDQRTLAIKESLLLLTTTWLQDFWYYRLLSLATGFSFVPFVSSPTPTQPVYAPLLSEFLLRRQKSVEHYLSLLFAYKLAQPPSTSLFDSWRKTFISHSFLSQFSCVHIRNSLFPDVHLMLPKLSPNS
jgi:hypothetical protein